MDCIVQSAQRKSGTVSKFKVNLGHSICAKKIILKRVVFPNVFYNVRQNVNDLVPLSTGDVIIPEGHYTIDEFVAQLTTTLGSATTYNEITMRLEFAGPLTFNWGSTSATNLANIQMGFLGNYSSGILEDITTSASPYSPNLSIEPFLLNIKGLHGNSTIHEEGVSTFLINPNVNKTQLSIEQYDFNNAEIDMGEENYIRQLEISLADMNENNLPAKYFIDWYFILRII